MWAICWTWQVRWVDVHFLVSVTCSTHSQLLRLIIINCMSYHFFALDTIEKKKKNNSLAFPVFKLRNGCKVRLLTTLLPLNALERGCLGVTHIVATWRTTRRCRRRYGIYFALSRWYIYIVCVSLTLLSHSYHSSSSFSSLFPVYLNVSTSNTRPSIPESSASWCALTSVSCRYNINTDTENIKILF